MYQKIILLLVAGVLLTACGEENNKRLTDASGVPYPDVELSSFKDRISYAIGADLGANFNNLPPHIFEEMKPKALEEGFYMGLTTDEDDRSECQAILQAAFSNPEGIDTSKNDMDLVSDCYGFIFGEMMRKSLHAKDAFSEIDADMAIKGFAHALFEVDTLIEKGERGKMVADFNNDMASKKGEQLMNEARNIEGAIVDDRGWVLVEEKAGNGAIINPENEFRIIYTIKTPNKDTVATTFVDASLSDEENAKVINTNDMLIPNGWMEATKNMRVGGEYTLYLPYDLAYGEQGWVNQNRSSYIVQPFTSVIIHSKVLEQAEIHSTAKKRGAAIIAEAKRKPKTSVGKSGYVLEVLEEGQGNKVPPGSDVKAHYILTNSEGEVIENSYMGASRGQGVPAFSLNGVIKGWQDAVPQMRKGGRYKLYLPYDIAYGERGNQGIPPFETLTFEMEIVDFGKPGTLVEQRRPQGM